MDALNVHHYFVDHGFSSVNLMNKKLIENQLNNNTVGYVGGLMDNQERQNVINLFKSGFVRVFISTDVASRGIDVENIPYIINMNIPLDVETYVHRAGRGGRTGGGHCICISLTDTTKERVWYHTCNSRNRSKQSSCHNTKDLSEGGCTTLIDEYTAMQNIITRIQKANEQCIELPITCQLPSTLDLSKVGKSKAPYRVEAEKYVSSIQKV